MPTFWVIGTSHVLFPLSNSIIERLTEGFGRENTSCDASKSPNLTIVFLLDYARLPVDYVHRL